ncbi:dipeptide epimerase [Haladaptatus sp. DYF46]|uniref:dipeptide epimerase n=1 Tax=Haladaptatus sp. DYF46 TaxID=2886041 RepID=UPI001E5701AB|nr:dipeptide epimerase [Haladaptatus sp. DYF46]
MSRIVDITAQPLDLPLTEPFEISLGVQHEAANVLVTVETESGVVGYGEGAPVPPVTGETREAALATARAAAAVVEGRPVGDYRRLVEALRSTFPGAVSANFAVETAVLDAFCRERDIVLSELFGGMPAPVETDITVPIDSVEGTVRRAEEAVESGFDHLKIKTGNDVHEDVERVVAVREVAEDAAIKVDANQGWTPKETRTFANAVADDGIELELIEQPVAAADVRGMADVRRHVDVPIAADEAVFTPADAVRIVEAGAADIINAKLGKSGPLAVADIVAIARGANLDCMIGCMLESSIGTHTGAHVVAGTGAFSYVDLDSNRLLAEDVVASGDGPIHEITGPGHGVTPSDV